ncbi:hypothetical protein ALO_20642 [Acetonema longum DSM 6540]|uniref:Uncharacterized protein n=1 Tax=Acetonema longum DSM 6540 TaxID=1009370 RepID=F7NPT1_9FIRM|nr:hypothetical protein ALO_20642 [Acetonema longum DSM 6540]
MQTAGDLTDRVRMLRRLLYFLSVRLEKWLDIEPMRRKNNALQAVFLQAQVGRRIHKSVLLSSFLRELTE